MSGCSGLTLLKDAKMKAHHVKAIQKSLHFTSRIMLLKGIVAGSVTALAVFGITTPFIGPLLHIAPHHSAVAGGIVATIGGLAGAALATRT